ncbi:hypothetical protein vseg_007774 [Gypsophila vaccaria]
MAVFAGCTYSGTEAQLQGPINDVSRMRDVLVQRFGFDLSNIEFMTDAPESTVMPTGANIRSALKRMFKRAQAGDLLFFHFSGHGTRDPKLDGDGEDEAIVPCDFNLIFDEEFQKLLKWLPKGARFTFLSDSCISSGFIDTENDHSTTPPCARCYAKTNRRIPRPGETPSRPAPLKENPRCVSYLPFRLPAFRPSAYPRKIPLTPPPSGPGSTAPAPPLAPPPPPPLAPPPAPPRTGKAKYLSHDFVLEHMRSVTKQDASHVGDLIGAHFGKDASPKFCKSQEEQHEPEKYLEPYIIVLFSGSNIGEISVDVTENTDAFGALSNAVQLVLNSPQGPITNQKIATRVRNTLEDQGFTKNHSCLYCSIKYDSSPFLS